PGPEYCLDQARSRLPQCVSRPSAPVRGQAPPGQFRRYLRKPDRSNTAGLMGNNPRMAVRVNSLRGRPSALNAHFRDGFDAIADTHFPVENGLVVLDSTEPETEDSCHFDVGEPFRHIIQNLLLTHGQWWICRSLPFDSGRRCWSCYEPPGKVGCDVALAAMD